MDELAIERHVLGNGLRLVMLRRTELPLVAVNLWYHVGSKNERPGRTGFAHLFEHMLFQGSEHVGVNDHFRYVQQVGGVANGSTWFDRTNYYETLPSHQLELGLWLESDRMGFLLPAMTAEKLETQRAVVMNERRQRVDNQPYGRAFERVHELLYPQDHPYRWPVIGYMEDIAAATLADVREFFSQYYRPNNCVLTLVGDFDPPAARSLVERYFGDLPAAARPPAPGAGMPPPRAERREETLEDRVRLPRVYVAWTVPAFGDERWYAASLLATVLTGGKASRLYRDLVYERQLAQSVVCSVFPTEECATFGVVVTGRPDGSVDQLRDEVFAAVRRVGADGIRDEEHDRALNGVLTGHYQELQSLDHLADSISAATTFFDEPERALREHEVYRSITPRQMAEVALQYLDAGGSTVVAVVPERA
jgi:zinc protease